MNGKRRVKLLLLCPLCVKRRHINARDTEIVVHPDNTMWLYWRCPTCGWQPLEITETESVGAAVGGSTILDWTHITLDDMPPILSPEAQDLWYSLADHSDQVVETLMVAAAMRILAGQ